MKSITPITTRTWSLLLPFVEGFLPFVLQLQVHSPTRRSQTCWEKGSRKSNETSKTNVRTHGYSLLGTSLSITLNVSSSYCTKVCIERGAVLSWAVKWKWNSPTLGRHKESPHMGTAPRRRPSDCSLPDSANGSLGVWLTKRLAERLSPGRVSHPPHRSKLREKSPTLGTRRNEWAWLETERTSLVVLARKTHPRLP